MKEYLKIKANAVDKVLKDYLEELKYPNVIADGMRYAVLDGGKRLRPVLLLMTLELFDADINQGLATGAAIEMIHAYSLVHDDLPALDNDDYRRGKFTVHKQFGEAQAILIGDSLLTYSFQVLAQKNGHLSPDKIVKIIDKTSVAAGIGGMIGGQMVDIESEGKKVDLPVLQYIHTHKTGMMIRLPVEAGLIIAGADAEKSRVMLEYADIIGLTFQIKDDILDVEGDFDKLGKPINSDIENEKSTYPSIFGMERAKEMLKEKTDRAKKIITETFGEKGKWFVQLADYIADREA